VMVVLECRDEMTIVADSACCLCYFDVVRNGSLWVLDVAVTGSVLSSSLVMFVGAALGRCRREARRRELQLGGSVEADVLIALMDGEVDAEGREQALELEARGRRGLRRAVGGA
jgi:hypothetical protein